MKKMQWKLFTFNIVTLSFCLGISISWMDASSADETTLSDAELTNRAAAYVNKDNNEGLEELIAQGLDLSEAGSLLPLLHRAAASDAIKCASTILTWGVAADVTDSFDRIPLHWARSSQMVMRLIKAGASIEKKDEEGQTPLHYASEMGYKDAVRALLKAGARVDSKNTDGETPLHAACSFGKEEIVDLLIAKGADISIRDNYGWSAFHYAAQSGNVSLVKKLLTPENLNAPTDDGQTPLWLASYDGLKETVAFLLSQGADYSIKDDQGLTPLDAARAGAHTDGDVPRNRDFNYDGVIRLLKAAQRRIIYLYSFLAAVLIGALTAAVLYRRRTRAIHGTGS